MQCSRKKMSFLLFLPKYGTVNATSNVETTKLVLMSIGVVWDVSRSGGSSSSMANATGVIANPNFVRGAATLITQQGKGCWGISPRIEAKHRVCVCVFLLPQPILQYWKQSIWLVDSMWTEYLWLHQTWGSRALPHQRRANQQLKSCINTYTTWSRYKEKSILQDLFENWIVMMMASI